eukprot:scaffold27211_cov63-Phaeocystis_antarctica.AAC.2
MRSSRDAYEVDFIFSSIWPMRLLPCLLSSRPPATGLQEVEEVLPPPSAARFASRACAASTSCLAWCISMVTSDDRELLSGGAGDVTHGTPNIFFATHECALPLIERSTTPTPATATPGLILPSLPPARPPPAMGKSTGAVAWLHGCTVAALATRLVVPPLNASKALEVAEGQARAAIHRGEVSHFYKGRARTADLASVPVPLVRSGLAARERRRFYGVIGSFAGHGKAPVGPTGSRPSGTLPAIAVGVHQVQCAAA